MRGSGLHHNTGWPGLYQGKDACGSLFQPLRRDAAATATRPGRRFGPSAELPACSAMLSSIQFSMVPPARCARYAPSTIPSADGRLQPVPWLEA